ncbi:rhodanese-like domain-containing protein [Trichloromonas sp.]|uniref:rhodanese-like domain-containing protein n=1 Tax=Trichloromonas sp. TaxID=3069249 RepID=UPI003D81514C
MKIDDLERKLKTPQAPCVVDVRSGMEFRSGHIPGAVHAPLLSILLRRVRLPQARETLLLLTCEHGPRAQLVKSVLGLFGYRNLDLLEGHMSAWRKAGLPME